MSRRKRNDLTIEVEAGEPCAPDQENAITTFANDSISDSHDVQQFAEERVLAVALTDEEMLAAARALAEAFGDMREICERRKEAMSGFKEELAEAQARHIEAWRLVRAGTEDRDVACMRTMDYTAGRVMIVRQDTGEIVSERDMTPLERQKQLV